MAEEDTKKNYLRKLFWILLTVVIIGFCLYYFKQFGCYFLDRRTFLSPIYHSGNIPIREDVFGYGDFGAQRRGKRLHLGADILAPVGTPVYAAKCGLVINAENNHGLGQYVEILHRDGLVTIYGHLSRIEVYQEL